MGLLLPVAPPSAADCCDPAAKSEELLATVWGHRNHHTQTLDSPRESVALPALGPAAGSIVGALGHLSAIRPRPDGIVQTIALGIAASLVAYYVFDEEGAGFLFSVLCAIALVYLVWKIRERGRFRTPP